MVAAALAQASTFRNTARLGGDIQHILARTAPQRTTSTPPVVGVRDTFLALLRVATKLAHAVSRGDRRSDRPNDLRRELEGAAASALIVLPGVRRALPERLLVRRLEGEQETAGEDGGQAIVRAVFVGVMRRGGGYVRVCEDCNEADGFEGVDDLREGECIVSNITASSQ